MPLHLYKDAALTDRISEGDLSNPDEDIYNGTDGESKDKEIFVANEQTTLAAGLTQIAITVQLAAARFGNFDILIVDNEQMRVTGGAGSTTLTVTRGFNGTVATTHTAGTPIYSATSYSSLSVDTVDTAGTSETSWVRVAKTQGQLDTATPGGSVNLGNKNHNVTTSFWRRITVPANSAIENKTDLKYRISGWENAV